MKRVEDIFIIDDDPITVFGIRKMLQAMEVAGSIHTFANGQEALEAIRARKDAGRRLPEVIFLDINMPIMDGWQFLDAFLKLPVANRIRVNIVTSSIDPADLEHFRRYKARTSHILEYRNKPLRRSDLDEITRAA